MKEHPILFSTDMVKQVLDGIKTQTRRVIRYQPPPYCDSVERLSTGTWNFYKQADPDFHAYLKKGCPYGQIGDRLWVRETHVLECDEEYQYEDYYTLATDRPIKTIPAEGEFSSYHLIPHYRATEPEPMICDDGEYTRWAPSLFMPRWASRITLEITEVRVERLQSITEEDCKREGTPELGWTEDGSWRNLPNCFELLWDSLNAKRGYGWEVNPWVWVISFKVVQ